MIADPRALCRAADPVTQSLAQLTCAVTETPWALERSDLARARDAGLSDAAVLQVVLLSSFFGHLNRMADAVGIELDYDVAQAPPRAAAATPPYLRPPVDRWPDPDASQPLALAQRPGLAEALAAWQRHALLRESPLDRRARARIAQAVAERLGDRAGARVELAPPASALDDALVAMADTVTLAPWRLGAATVASLRAAGLVADAAVFDALATAAACTSFSRIAVALAALGR